MLFGRYLFECKFTSEAELPAYKGSTFRGVFGRALKQVVCVARNNNCEACLVKNQCLYVLVFETRFSANLPENSRLSAPPHPFVIEPPADGSTRYKAGTRFGFNLLLFGHLNNYLAYFIYAFERMGRIGIGRKINRKRATFRLEWVRGNDTNLYDGNEGVLHPPGRLTELGITPDPVPGPKIETIHIRLQTPLRLKYQNHLKPDLPFHVLVRALLRRISSLQAAYNGGEPDLDYRGLVHRAQQVAIIQSDLQWADWRRYSFRQKKEMKFGGIIGDIIYKGNLDEFWPLIQFGSQAHIGKQTAFGLGKFEVTNINTSFDSVPNVT